jgi:hypothetical protein
MSQTTTAATASGSTWAVVPLPPLRVLHLELDNHSLPGSARRRPQKTMVNSCIQAYEPIELSTASTHMRMLARFIAWAKERKREILPWTVELDDLVFNEPEHQVGHASDGLTTSPWGDSEVRTFRREASRGAESAIDSQPRWQTSRHPSCCTWVDVAAT